MSNTNLTQPIDLYDTPIDMRPLPKKGPEELRIEIISECVEYLREHGDHYGVQLLNGKQQKDTSKIESPSPQEGVGAVRPDAE